MKERIIKITLSLIFFCITMHAEKKEAVCIVPVADLLGCHSGTFSKNSATTIYEQLPVNGPSTQVKRIDQLLFNEHVFIIEQKGAESRIHIPTHSYCTTTDATLCHEYWILTKNIIPISETQDTNAIPSRSPAPNTIITLTQPFQDNKYHQLYSAGTRFVLDTEQDDDNYYRVLIISPRLKTGHIYIPKKYCLENNQLTHQQKIQNFLAILENFADQTPGYIPYIFGGNSFIKQYHNPSIMRKSGETLTTSYPTHAQVHCGFDCASLIFRAAQIADIPLYFKNSSALKHHLRPLANNEPVENGDIIFIPGHIIAIFDKDNNLAIEARTQTHGYGFVHKIAFADLFKEIETIEQLVAYHHSKKLASRLNINHEILVRVPITIFKLKSVFEK